MDRDAIYRRRAGLGGKIMNLLMDMLSLTCLQNSMWRCWPVTGCVDMELRRQFAAGNIFQSLQHENEMSKVTLV